MGIFKRMKDGISSKANAAIDKAIDPEKELEMAILELEEGRKKALQELISYKATARQMEDEIAKYKERAEGWLQVLNDYWLGPTRKYLCGDQITIADYFGVCLLTLGEVIGCDFGAYPNVERWLGNMKRLASWPKINEALYGYAEAVKGQPFVRI